jgi:alginate O-acetyltransferase complex protein AlgI
MLFVEARFFVFFAIVFAVTWSLRGNRERKLFLLGASYFFYAAWDWRFLSLIFISTAIDYVAGLMIARESPRFGRRSWLLASIAANLGILGFFKYYNFFVDSGTDLCDLFGLHFPARTLDIVLPVGISFFTFQSMSYTFDIYQKKLEPIHSPLDFALFVSFFPQLVAGPIVRAASFLPQLTRVRRFADVEVRRFLGLFLLGFVKKACVADQLSVASDPVFANPEAYGAASKWIAVGLYHVQIYCDFSGYTDMATATAGLLGYKLTRNFFFPYIGRSISDMWTRWHISLLSWFRDYIFVPLAKKSSRPAWNLFCVMVLMLASGLWHGAAWHFVVWGMFHGLVLIVERTPFLAFMQRRPVFVQIAYCQIVVLVNWVFFRCQDLPSAFSFLADMFWPISEPLVAGETPLPWPWLLAVVGFTAAQGLAYRTRPLTRLHRVPPLAFALAYGVAWALVLPWVATGHRPFIYFQF